MTAPATKTEISAELLAAWRDFYATHDTIIPPFRDPDPDALGADGWTDRVILAGLQRVIDGVTSRAAAQGVQS